MVIENEGKDNCPKPQKAKRPAKGLQALKDLKRGQVLMLNN
jgi:hypothetical protein